MQIITILIAEDHRLVRESWKVFLANDPRFLIVAETGNGKEAIRLAHEMRPDIVLMDINMEPVSGFEATKEIQKCSPGSRVIGLSMHRHPNFTRKMLKMGAAGYLTKNCSCEELLLAIVEVAKGKTYICDEIRQLLVGELISPKGGSGLADLTRRESDIIQLVRKGCSSKEISEELNISYKTVETHRYNILRKLDLKNTASLINVVNTSGW